MLSVLFVADIELRQQYLAIDIRDLVVFFPICLHFLRKEFLIRLVQHSKIIHLNRLSLHLHIVGIRLGLVVESRILQQVLSFFLQIRVFLLSLWFLALTLLVSVDKTVLVYCLVFGRVQRLHLCPKTFRGQLIELLFVILVESFWRVWLVLVELLVTWLRIVVVTVLGRNHVGAREEFWL